MRGVTFILIFIWTQSIALADVSSGSFRFETTTPPESPGTPAPPQPPDTPAPAVQSTSTTATPPPASPSQESTSPTPQPPTTPSANSGISYQEFKSDMDQIEKNFVDTTLFIRLENKKHNAKYELVPIDDAFRHLSITPPTSDNAHLKLQILNSPDYIDLDNALDPAFDANAQRKQDPSLLNLEPSETRTRGLEGKETFHIIDKPIGYLDSLLLNRQLKFSEKFLGIYPILRKPQSNPSHPSGALGYLFPILLLPERKFSIPENTDNTYPPRILEEAVTQIRTYQQQVLDHASDFLPLNRPNPNELLAHAVYHSYPKELNEATAEDIQAFGQDYYNQSSAKTENQYFSDFYQWAIVTPDRTKSSGITYDRINQIPLPTHYHFLGTQTLLKNADAHSSFLQTPVSQWYAGLPIFRHPLEFMTASTYFLRHRQPNKTLLYKKQAAVSNPQNFETEIMKFWPKVSITPSTDSPQPTIQFSYPEISRIGNLVSTRLSADNLTLVDMWLGISEILKPTSMTADSIRDGAIFSISKPEQTPKDRRVVEASEDFFSLKEYKKLTDQYASLDQRYAQKLADFERDILAQQTQTQKAPSLFAEIAEILGGNGLIDITLVPSFDTRTEGIASDSYLTIQRSKFSEQVTRTRSDYTAGNDDMVQGLIIPAPLFELLDHYHRVRFPKHFGGKGMDTIETGFQATAFWGLYKGPFYKAIDSEFPMKEALYVNNQGRVINGITLTTLVFAFNLLLFYKLHKLCQTTGTLQSFVQDLKLRADQANRDFRTAHYVTPEKATTPSTGTGSPKDPREALAESLSTSLDKIMNNIINPEDMELIETYCYRVPFLPLRSSFFPFTEAPAPLRPPPPGGGIIPETTPTEKCPSHIAKDSDRFFQRGKWAHLERGANARRFSSTKESINQMNDECGFRGEGSIRRQFDRFLTNYWKHIVWAVVLAIVIPILVKTLKKK